MKRPDVVDFLFAVLVISVSFVPLLSVPGWQSSGPAGGYSCNCGQYLVRFSDPTVGGDKPRIYASYNGFQVGVMEVSDTTSSVDGLNLYPNFTAKPGLRGGGLTVNYSSPLLNFTKLVAVNSGTVNVSYSFGRNVTALISLWRSYFASVGPFDRPVTRELGNEGNFSFTFFDQGTLFNASVTANPKPAHAEISGVEGVGLNKIALTFNATKIDLAMKLSSVKPLAGVGVVDVGSSNYAFPIIGVGLALSYLAIRRELGGKGK
jgi:hypothetical protein